MLTKKIIPFLIPFVFASCGGDEPAPSTTDATVAVSQSSLEFTSSAAEASFTVTASGEWTAISEAAWITVTNTGTTNNTGSVLVKVSENTSLTDRAGNILVKAGKARATVSVLQKGRVPAPADPSIEVPEGYTLVWNDEFDSGTSLNNEYWTHQSAGPGWVNNELQTYVNGSFDGRAVTEITNGHLAITAFKSGGKVYSGRVYALQNQGWTYGIFEAAIRLPKGKGTWPAFWMMPVHYDANTNPWPRCGEIDIMEEVGYHPNYTSSSIHCENYNHMKGTQKTAERLTSGAQDDYHIYRLEWTEDYIRTYVDGRLLLSFDNDHKGNVAAWPFNKPFYVILNLAWGGDWGGAQGVDESCLPATMEVDYVRVFQRLP